MLALIAAVMLSSPAPKLEPACDESGFPIASVAACRASCSWWSKPEQRCRDVDVENLGAWDPRPAPSEWSTYAGGLSTPPAWGNYPTEKSTP